MRPNLSNLHNTKAAHAKVNISDQNSGYIRLEIKAITLKRLLHEESIVIEEIRGLNKQAKQLAWQAILQSV